MRSTRWTIHLLAVLLLTNPVSAMMDPRKAPPNRKNKAHLLLLDIDNTVYEEAHAQIEAQIVANTHRYCQDILHISREQADALFRDFGSTIEGLRQTLWKDLTTEELSEKMHAFYHAVYDDLIDVSKLLLSSSSTIHKESTGYNHGERLTRQLLKHAPMDLSVASNSPSWHIQKVLRAMGLAKLLATKRQYTPDRLSSFPTKHAPVEFFEDRIQHYDSVAFLDDSAHNLQRVKEAFPKIHTHHIHHHSNSLSNALLQAYGLLDPSYKFSQIEYLHAKNKVDRQSMHVDTWNQVIKELNECNDDNEPIWIVDLGAGLLSILDLLLHGDEERGLMLLDDNDTRIQYTAYESNRELYNACHDRLESWGFRLIERISPVEAVYERQQQQRTAGSFQVRLIMESFSKRPAIKKPPNLIVGCCFADLMDPDVLVADLMRSFSLLQKDSSSPSTGTLIYFPITFAGVTQFVPACPFEHPQHERVIPSDTVAFRWYSHALTHTLGHNLAPRAIVASMEDHGVEHLQTGPSDWKIDPKRDSYLYETMLYFFGSTAGPALLKQGYDAAGWIQRARENCPSIQVTNQDLLFRMPPIGIENASSQSQKTLEESFLKEILFTAPHEVTAVEKDFPSKLGPREVLIQSSYSLISSGTELKIFKGDFDDDAPLDVNIQDMADERMAYPLAYGYCLVGRIIACGDGLSQEDYFGKLVFTFSPHATHVVTDVDAIQFVPDGIDPKDAIFMPSVETALSLVHDAHIRMGENVAVYGQGLIGLLVTALLSSSASNLANGQYGSITVFDMLPDRLSASSSMGASQALFPGGCKGPFDVTVEVSGNARALQSAIDCTRDGGRVIVGSWYGSSDISLKLGIDFHRSHKTIQTSQVSTIPAGQSKLWSKERRFGLTWELVKEIRPACLLSKTVLLDNAQEAYEALDGGTEIAVAFDYSRQ